MKKLVLGIFFSFFAVTSQAAEEIKIVWAFSIGSNQANTVRILIEEANKIQNKYNFVLENKKGAGGSIAANYVLQNPNDTIVAMSSSFFIRPSYTKEGAHDLNKFQAIKVQATGAPLGVVSSKYKDLEDLKKQESPSIAIAGVGSISDIVAHALKLEIPKIKIIPFKSMVDGIVGAAGGHVDSAVTIIVDAEPYIESGQLNLIANTGSENINGSKKITDTLDLTANYGMFASKEMDVSRAKEIHQIFTAVNALPKVLASYKKDRLNPVTLDFADSQKWYISEVKSWKNFVSKINN